MKIFYAKLNDREAVFKDVPVRRFALRNQTPLTRSEAIYAPDAVAARNHIRFVVNEKQVKLRPDAQTRKDAEANRSSTQESP